MKFWFVCLAVVFGMTELYQWFQGLILPMPLYGAAGLLLALLSNSNQWMPRFWEAARLEVTPLSAGEPSQIKPPIETGEIQSGETMQLPLSLQLPQTPTQGEPQLPNLSAN